MRRTDRRLRREWLLAAVLLMATAEAAAEPAVRIAIAADTGDGTGPAYAEALAALWSETVAGLEASAVGARPSKDLLDGLATDKIDVALIGSATLQQAATGDPPQALFAAYPLEAQLLLRSEPDEAQIPGSRTGRIAVSGPYPAAAGLADAALERLLKAGYHLTEKPLTLPEALDALRWGTVDGAILLAHGTDPRVEALVRSSDVERIPLATGTRPTVWKLAVTAAAMPADQAHALTRAVFENLDRLAAMVSAAAAASIADTATHVTLPLHSGAARYLAEQGFPPPE